MAMISDMFLEGLPALPSLVDLWLEDVVSPEREPALYAMVRMYVLRLLADNNEDGTHTFETYGARMARFVDRYLDRCRRSQGR